MSKHLVIMALQSFNFLLEEPKLQVLAFSNFTQFLSSGFVIQKYTFEADKAQNMKTFAPLL